MTPQRAPNGSGDETVSNGRPAGGGAPEPLLSPTPDEPTPEPRRFGAAQWPLPGLIWLHPNGVVADACDQAGAILDSHRRLLVGQPLYTCLTDADLVPDDAVAEWPVGRPGEPTRVAYARGPARHRVLRLSLCWRTGREHFVVVEDLTAHRRLERRLSQTTDRLEQLDSMMLRLEATAPLVHDLNNLLTVLNGEATVALRTRPDRDPTGALERIAALAGRATELARRMTRGIRSRSPDAARRVTDLGSVLRAMEEGLRTCLAPGQELRVITVEGPCIVGLSAREIERIVLNLVVNARDAMDSAGTVAIEVGPLDDAKVALSVTDTGAGMSTAVAERAFESLFTTKLAGTGLGLAVIRRVIHGAGGEVALETAEGEGTCVRIVLPAC